MTRWRTETIGDATLHLGDCMEVMPTLSGIDAIVTDPPYGVGFDYESYEDEPGRHAVSCVEWVDALRRVTGGPIAVATGRRHLMAWPQPDWVMCWHKPACMGPAPVGFTNWEPVLLYGKARGPKTVDFFTVPIVPNNDANGHPCPKPVGWAAALISKLTIDGDCVLDPFVGSGTTGVAAIKLDRRFVGIEKEPKYFEIACRRLDEAWRQPRLFQAIAPKQQALALCLPETPTGADQ